MEIQFQIRMASATIRNSREVVARYEVGKAGSETICRYSGMFRFATKSTASPVLLI